MTPIKNHPVWGDGVRLLRGTAGLTQIQLAEAADTTQKTVSRIERGGRAISDGLRVRLARALGVDPHDLFPYEHDGAA